MMWTARRHKAALGHVWIVAAWLAAGASLTAGSDAAPVVTTTARAIQPGEVVRIDVRCACAGPAPAANAFGTTVALERVAGSDRWQGFLGIDLDVAPGVYPLVVAEGDDPDRARTVVLTVAPRQFRTRQLQVAPAYVDPPPETVERILDEAAHLDALFRTVSPRAWQGTFDAPLAGRSSDTFGARSVFNGEARAPHAGLDYSRPTGTPVQAPAAGQVVLAQDLYFTGRTVVIDHGLGLFTVLAHLSTIAVESGARIDGGTIVGRVGATGRATGPHLHWGVRLYGARVDPLSMIAAATR